MIKGMYGNIYLSGYNIEAYIFNCYSNNIAVVFEDNNGYIFY